MKSTWMTSWIEEEFERRREEEFQATLRRPDALPLPPVEPTASFGDRLSRVVNGWMNHLPSQSAARAATVRPAPAIRRRDDGATTA
jgi:broad specificity phosphatase PhoE